MLALHGSIWNKAALFKKCMIKIKNIGKKIFAIKNNNAEILTFH